MQRRAANAEESVDGVTVTLVVTAGRTPVADAVIAIGGDERARTDRAGVAQVPGLAAGVVQFVIRAPGYAQVRRGLGIPDERDGRMRVRVRLLAADAARGDREPPAVAAHLAPPVDAAATAVIRGRVTCDGAPVERFGLALVEGERVLATAPLGVVSATGEFALPARPGRWLLAVRGAATRERRLPVTITAAGVCELGEIALARGATAFGRVLDPAGRPVAGATVSLGTATSAHLELTELALSWCGHGTATTDARGEFAIGGLDAEPPALPGPRTLWAEQPGVGASARLAWDAARAGDHVLVLEPTGFLSARVPAGLGALLAVTRADEPAGARMAPATREGLLAVGELPVGCYALSVWVAGRVVARIGEVAVTADADVDLGDLAIPPLVAVDVRVSVAALERPVLAPQGGAPLRSSLRSTVGDHYRSFHYDAVSPGPHRLSLDGGLTWEDVVIAASPTRQVVARVAGPR